LTAGEPNGGEMEMVRAGAAAVLNKADVFQQLYPLIVKSCADTKQSAITPGHFGSPPLSDSILL
jgi:hypothetical protein